jgi:hypothetical protein
MTLTLRAHPFAVAVDKMDPDFKLDSTGTSIGTGVLVKKIPFGKKVIKGQASIRSECLFLLQKSIPVPVMFDTDLNSKSS